jgi:hypothetical protein
MAIDSSCRPQQPAAARRTAPHGETRWQVAAGRIALLILACVLAGCAAPRPDFTERTRQDCARGDRDACRMLEAFDPSRPAKPPPPPPKRVERPRPTRVETDVQAIMRGMEQARSIPRAGYQENVPSQAAPMHDQPDAPAPPPPDSP